MGKNLLLMLVMSSLFLVGCGQNIDKIAAELNADSDIKAEYEFEGYVAIADKESIDEAQAFIDANRLNPDIFISADLSLGELPDLDYTPDEFDKVEDIHEQISKRLAEFDDEVKAEVQAIVQQYQSEQDRYNAEVASLKSQLAEYESQFAEEQALFDESKAIFDGFINLRKQTERDFDVALRQVIIDEGLPVDVNKNFDLDEQYKDSKDSKYCSTFRETTAQIAMESGGCVYVARYVKTPALQQVIVEHAAIYEKAIRDLTAYRDTYYSAERALNNAKIVAKNRTGVNVRKIQSAIKQAETRAASAKKKGEYRADPERLIKDLARNDSTLRRLRSEYMDAVYQYTRAVRKEAASLVDIDIETFSDENDSYSVSDDERAVAVYVLEREGGVPIVKIGRLSAKKERSFYDVFKHSQVVGGNVEIKDESDVVSFISHQIAGV